MKKIISGWNNFQSRSFSLGNPLNNLRLFIGSSFSCLSDVQIDDDCFNSYKFHSLL